MSDSLPFGGQLEQVTTSTYIGRYLVPTPKSVGNTREKKESTRGFCIENRLSTCVETKMNQLRQW
jgi:hypothetical protein